MDWQTLQIPNELQESSDWNDLRIDSRHPEESSIEVSHISVLPKFKYEPLDIDRSEIRLFYLHGPVTLNSHHDRQSLPSGTVQTVSLDVAPSYTALSYCWGDAIEKFPIILNGALFHVTRNLHDALLQLQDSERILPIWIDAICINQADIVEKGKLVQQMDRIYREARLVIGWLGPMADNSDLAMRALAYIGDASEYLPDDESQRWTARRDFLCEIITIDSSISHRKFPTVEIAALYNRHWWQRMWIVQEVVLAQKVYALCGTASTTFRSLTLAFTLLYSIPHVNALCQGQLTSHLAAIAPVLKCDPRLIQAAIRGQAQNRVPLTQRLDEVQGLQVSDKRDVIYGLLGMVNDANSLGIQVDYDLSIAQLFTLVTSALIQKERQLRVLAKCKTSASVVNLPSWVPDWSHTSKVPIWYQDRKLYSAGGTNIFTSAKVNHSELTIAGSVFDTISDLGPHWTDGQLTDDPAAVKAKLLEIEKFAKHACYAYPSPEEFQDAIARTPIADREMSTNAGRDRVEQRAGPSCCSVFTMLTSEAARYPGGVDRGALFSYMTHVVGLLSGRRLFATRKGYLGMGPESVLTGDWVSTFSGAEVPFVLRQISNGTQVRSSFWNREQPKFTLVGECYVHGAMDGQFWKSIIGGRDFVLS